MLRRSGEASVRVTHFTATSVLWVGFIWPHCHSEFSEALGPLACELSLKPDDSLRSLLKTSGALTWPRTVLAGAASTQRGTLRTLPAQRCFCPTQARTCYSPGSAVGSAELIKAHLDHIPPRPADFYSDSTLTLWTLALLNALRAAGDLSVV